MSEIWRVSQFWGFVFCLFLNVVWIRLLVKGSYFGFWFAVGNVCHSVTWWVFLFQQKGDEGEEGVTSEGTTLWFFSSNTSSSPSCILNTFLFFYFFLCLCPQNLTSSLRREPKLLRGSPAYRRPRVVTQEQCKEPLAAKSQKDPRTLCLPRRPPSFDLRFPLQP